MSFLAKQLSFVKKFSKSKVIMLLLVITVAFLFLHYLTPKKEGFESLQAKMNRLKQQAADAAAKLKAIEEAARAATAKKLADAAAATKKAAEDAAAATKAGWDKTFTPENVTTGAMNVNSTVIGGFDCATNCRGAIQNAQKTLEGKDAYKYLQKWSNADAKKAYDVCNSMEASCVSSCKSVKDPASYATTLATAFAVAITNTVLDSLPPSEGVEIARASVACKWASPF